MYVAKRCKKYGLVRESNPGPLAPEARIIPLDQQASTESSVLKFSTNSEHYTKIIMDSASVLTL